MQRDTETANHPTNIPSSFSLLQYEINRIKSHIDFHGECPAMQKRLEQLENLLQQGLAPVAGESPG